jgi:RNA polymerase sigma-70 factor (ECF subfamily)
MKRCLCIACFVVLGLTVAAAGCDGTDGRPGSGRFDGHPVLGPMVAGVISVLGRPDFRVGNRSLCRLGRGTPTDFSMEALFRRSNGTPRAWSVVFASAARSATLGELLGRRPLVLQAAIRSGYGDLYKLVRGYHCRSTSTCVGEFGPAQRAAAPDLQYAAHARDAALDLDAVLRRRMKPRSPFRTTKEPTRFNESSVRMGREPEGAGLDEIEAVYRQRLAELRRVATAITGSRETGLDAVQDAFARAIRQRHSFRGEGNLDAWLWRIVVNTARTTTARSSSDLPIDADLAARDGDGPATPDPYNVHTLVRQLPDRQRLALFLRYYADLDYATIAGALDIAAGTVGATLNQARESLRRALEEVRS